MATISMCDRCGNMGLSSAIGTLVFHSGPNARTEKRELCPECVGEIMAWLGETPERENRVAFREEWQPATKEIESPKEWRIPDPE